MGTEFGAASERARELRSGRAGLGGRVALRAAAERWMQVHVRTRRQARDQAMTQQRLDDYLFGYLGHMMLGQVTKDDVRSYRLWLERDGRLKPATVKHILSDLRCLLNWAVGSDLMDRSPFPRGVMPKLQERPPDRLTDEAVAALVELPEPYGFVCRLGLGTGLRWGELIRAQSSDVQNGALVVHQTKSGKVRRVPLAPELLAEVRVRVGRLMPFTDGTGFSRQVRRLSGIEGFHPHQMRHTYACRMLEGQVSLAAVQQLLGHSTVVMTQRYASIGDEMVRREGGACGNAVRTGSSTVARPGATSCT